MFIMYVCINASDVIYAIFFLCHEYLISLPCELGFLCEGW